MLCKSRAGLLKTGLLLAILLTTTLFFSCETNEIPDDNGEDLSEDTTMHEDASDYVWDSSSETAIVFSNDRITANSESVSISGSCATVTKPGNYSLTGSLADGLLVINSTETGIIRLIFRNLSIANQTGPALFLQKGSKVIVILEEGTANSLTDGISYSEEWTGDLGANACLFAKTDLTLYGNGKLGITGRYADGIHGKDGIIIRNADLAVSALDEGIRGKDYLLVYGGNLVVATTGDASLETSGSGSQPVYCAALKSDHDIILDGCLADIRSTGRAGKGISAGVNLTIEGGEVTVRAPGVGNTYTNSSGEKDAYTATCLRADGNITLVSGTITLEASGAGGDGITCDGDLTLGSPTGAPIVSVTTSGAKITLSGNGREVDANEAKAISTKGSVFVYNGTTTISSADDGMKSDKAITVEGGTVSIIKSVEGMESPSITINGGNVSLVCSDDGFNATKGTGGEASDGSSLNLNGGYVTVNCSGGDGLDSNGDFTMKGGTVIVHGPQSQPEVGMDVNGTASIEGGILVVSGINSNMTEGLSSGSGQYSVLAKTNSAIQASSLFHLQDADGNNILTFMAVRNYSYIIFSSPQLKNGSTLSLYTGGSFTGAASSGLLTEGNYSGGTLKKSFTLSGKVTGVSF